ncbi:MAG: rhodanese-like domain-containing protein [Actinomycetota bacterium]
MTTTITQAPVRSRVSAVPPASPVLAARHFQWRLGFETDPADVHADLERGGAEFTLVDTRSREAFAAGHIPGAVNVPYAEIDETTAGLPPRDRLAVTYCSSPACNAATKGAAAFAALGYQVKEMLGGLEYWQREGYPIQASESHAA